MCRIPSVVLSDAARAAAFNFEKSPQPFVGRSVLPKGMELSMFNSRPLYSNQCAPQTALQLARATLRFLRVSSLCSPAFLAFEASLLGLRCAELAPLSPEFVTLTKLGRLLRVVV